MEIDERHCPNCGHDVLNWDVVCPGCDQVPWDSPAGKRIMQQRRRRHFLISGGPIAAFLVLVGVLLVIGNVHLGKASRWSGQIHDLQEVIGQGEWILGMLAQGELGTSEYEKLMAASRQWLAQGLPVLLGVVRDTRAPRAIRAAAAKSVLSLLQASHPLRNELRAYRKEVIDAFTPLLTERDETLKRVATAVLGGLEAAY